MILFRGTLEFLRELYEEYSKWYLSIAEENGVLLRSSSCVAADGRQFIACKLPMVPVRIVIPAMPAFNPHKNPDSVTLIVVLMAIFNDV